MDISERVLHFPKFRRPTQLQRRVATLDRERQLLAGSSADRSLHIRKASDLLAIDRRYHVAVLKAGCRRGAARFHLIYPRRRAWFAEEREQTGKDHDGQQEVGNRAGGHDRGPRPYLLVVETARALFFGHDGERFG